MLRSLVGSEMCIRDRHHVDPAVGTYAWAHTGNLTTVPGNKLESLSQTAPTTWADGDAFSTIDPSWLPAQATDLDGLTDVTITTPIADNEMLRYDTDTSMWVNRSYLSQTTTTQTGGTDVIVTDSNGIRFIAAAVAAASATVGNFNDVNLYSSTGTVSRSLVVSTSNFENNPTITATVTNAGGATGLNVNVSGTQVTVSGIDTTVVRTITVQVTVSDGTTQVTQVNRDIDIVDNRRILFADIPFEFDLAGADDLQITVTDGASGARLDSDAYTYTLNTGTTVTGQNNPFDVPRTSADWTIGPNTITATAVETRAPIRTYSITSHNIQGFRAYFFFASATTPGDVTDFPAASASTVEFLSLIHI